LVVDDDSELIFELGKVDLFDLVVRELAEVHQNQLRSLFLVLLEEFKIFFVFVQEIVNEEEDQKFSSMVPFIVLLDALEKILKAFATLHEPFPKNHGNLPNSLIDVGTNRRMQIFMFHNIEILIGSIAALVFLDAHNELAVYDFLGVLVRSHAGVDELD
jgi:hypothetical protein